jgi:hypothetical protein
MSVAGAGFTLLRPASAAQMTHKFALCNKNAKIVGVMAMSQIGKKMTKDKEMRATVDLDSMPDGIDNYEDAACFLLMELHKQNHALSRIMASLCDTGTNHDDEVMEWLSQVIIKQQYFYDLMKDWRPVDEKKPGKPAGDVVDIKTKH